MWHSLAAFIIRFRIFLLIALTALTGVFGYYATKVQLTYEFSSAVPADNPEYIAYQSFRKQFGEDGNTLVVGVKTNKFFEPAFFADYVALTKSLQKVKGVDNIMSVPTAVNLIKDTVTDKLQVVKLVPDSVAPDAETFKTTFYNLPFYNGLLYNPETGAYLMGLRMNKKIINSPERVAVVDEIARLCDDFGRKHNVQMHYSGLPFIRTMMASNVQREMKLFIILSFALTALILTIFFRSFMAVFASMLVVAAGVIWSQATMYMLDYKITLLTALIPPLIVVIGIPNCVYLLNKYHSEYNAHGDKRLALLNMVGKMGIITLFTNLTAAIGFGVFYFTKSALLREFGAVAFINIMAIFVISLVFIPALFSLLPAPKGKHTNYLESKWINDLLSTLTTWVFNHRKWIYGATIIACIVSAVGMMRLNSVGYIVDDLPKKEKVYQDLKFFEKNFKGVMPLEVVIDTRRKNGATQLPTLEKIDELTQYLKQYKEIGHPLSIVEGIKFARQAYYDGDSSSYGVPNMFDGSFIQPYLRGQQNNGSAQSQAFNSLINSFMDSTRQKTRVSIGLADVGSQRLPQLLDSIRPKAQEIFDTSKYTVTFTGTSIVFLEGSKFIINSLRDSLILAFIMIFGCMIFLFRSWKILLIALVTNVVPLLITAGIMGWADVPIKPSTVLVFSVALGITIDVTIRFLVSYKQELKNKKTIAGTVRKTIADTGLSIIYTSVILIAGFGVFALSHFDGTKSLGYLTSLTLLLAMITNLTLQPALLVWIGKKKDLKCSDPEE
ncbi:MAG TPA: MMPL family transporter [Flavipsychrobacter sp.]|nr:MMPL family transporter [Flavipsychrobacter sp.]